MLALRVPLSPAVAASSAFPPFPSPARLELDPAQFAAAEGEPLRSDEFMRTVYVNNGGV